MKTTIDYHQMILAEQDIWKVEEIGLKPCHGIYKLNFSKLRPIWLKNAMKSFVRFQAATKSVATCCSYIMGLAHFGDFIEKHFPKISPDKVDRSIVVKYIEYLAKSNLAVETRNITLIHLRTFHTIIVQEKWLPWPLHPLIYRTDFISRVEHIPRYIPEYILAQLQQHMPHLSVHMKNFVIILLETGRRVGEIYSLPFNCIEQDGENDFFLQVSDRKLNKNYLIPISNACTNAIKNQQNHVLEKYPGNYYLFPTPAKHSKTPHITRISVTNALNKLAHKYKISDELGNIWHFHPHQFRHTVGTRMINAAVPQAIVQKYLGHESPKMTLRYAHIHNATLKEAFNKYQGQLVNIYGENRSRIVQEDRNEARWLRHNIMAQALPNGICSLPLSQQRCPHANACLTCIHFRTNQNFLPQHKAQLEITNQIIEAAKKNDWQRQVEMNLVVKKNLEVIIKNLQEE